MKYMGSKRRLWKHIAPFILSNRSNKQYYVEPFCGGCNSICNVDGLRIASDINPFLISMFRGLIDGNKVTFDIDKPYYDKVRWSYRNGDNKFSDFEKGWVGYMASYNGRFFDGGYSGISAGRNYIHESMLDIINQIDKLIGVEFNCCSYDKLIIPKNSIIYCDIPYKNSKAYDKIVFDYDKFYEWCFKMRDIGNRIYISEYSMPSDFNCIWEKEVVCNINIEKNKRIEKLFTI